jgi:hypothetical protein
MTPSPSTPFLPPNPALETSILAIGKTLFAAMDAHPAPGIFSKKGAYARVMEWSMKDPAFKAQLFRFVDVLPSLGSSAEIVRHLQEYLGDKAVELNPAMKVGLAASSFAPGLIAGPVKANVVSMAAQFVAGETGADLLKQIKRNHALGLATTIDLLGETVVSETEADAFLARNLEILDSVSAYYAKNPAPCFSDVTARSPLIDLGSTWVGQAEEGSRLVKGLASGVVDRTAESFQVGRSADKKQRRVSAAGHEPDAWVTHPLAMRESAGVEMRRNVVVAHDRDAECCCDRLAG